MKNIYFFKPIILEKALDDMKDAIQSEEALLLLHGKKFLAYTEDGLELFYGKSTDHLPARYFYGSEAVVLYRQYLGLPDVSIRTLDVNSILSEVPDYNALRDIFYFLQEIEFLNKHAKHFLGFDEGDQSTFTQYLQLQELVECLEDNGHRPSPTTREFMSSAGDDEKDKDSKLLSLKDIGISLLPVGKEDASPAGKAHRTVEKQLLDNIFGEDLCPYEE